MVEVASEILLTSLYLSLSAVLLLVTYACLKSLWYSLASCWDRVRDYLDGQGNSS